MSMTVKLGATAATMSPTRPAAVRMTMMRRLPKTEPSFMANGTVISETRTKVTVNQAMCGVRMCSAICGMALLPIDPTTVSSWAGQTRRSATASGRDTAGRLSAVSAAAAG